MTGGGDSMDRDPLADVGRAPSSLPDESRRLAPRAMAALVMAAVLALGVAAGIALDRGVLHGGRPHRDDRAFVPGAAMPHEPMGPAAGAPRHRPPSFDRFVHELGLSATQATAVDSVMAQDFVAIRALRATMQPSVDSIIARTRQRIDSILTPAQRDQYHTMLAQQQERLERMRRGNAGPPRP